MKRVADFSQLKQLVVPAQEIQPKPKVEPSKKDDLSEFASSKDYFAGLLEAAMPSQKVGRKIESRHVVATSHHVISASVTEKPDTSVFVEPSGINIDKVRMDEAKEIASLKTQLAASEKQLSESQNQLSASQNQLAASQKQIEALERQARAGTDPAENKDREITDLKRRVSEFEKKYAEALREIEKLQSKLDVAGSVRSVLNSPKSFAEEFDGEIREHVVEALAEALSQAENGKRQRRAIILQAVLTANPIPGCLESLRNRIKSICKDIGYKLGESSIKQFKELGFKYISGNTHHKFEWGGLRVTMSKTASDHCSGKNSTTEINNRFF